MDNIAQTGVVEFGSLDELDSADVGHLFIEINGRLTDWKWTFAGPGHEKTVAYEDRQLRDRLHRDKQLEQQRLNGKKVKLPDETVDEVRERNIAWVLGRLIGWSPVKIGGEMFTFSEENARRILTDRSKSDILRQAVEFLTDEKAFTRRSETS